MLLLIVAILYGIPQANAADQTVNIANFFLSKTLSTFTGGQNPCQKPKQFVSAIKLHTKGGAAQIYTLQVLDSQNTWQTLNVSGRLDANKDTPWLPLTFGSDRCVSQVLVYGNGIDSPIQLQVFANVSVSK